MRKNIFTLGLALLFAVVLGGCGSPSGMDHNADDVAFAQQMVPHHSQALDMAKLVPSRSTNPKVLDLASRIEKAQDPEIQQMQGWLTTWGAGMPGMTHGSMPGMMPDADMRKLEAAKGPEFDRMWLDMMVEHHQGAIDMANTELAKGGNADAKALARKIIDAQQAEITEMRSLR
ncbi:DUF305 domain-containing protein [Amycolatopsis sp. SID8362]|uniref:DUF305 domain-containing protein n=1 Tax=Amycolatopsis sp. SID8362 TaxID=2690346 RepID=UPI001370910E|nr:DUF305 domain-containing protein [Amycolatopsis sp. SID8362]NBH10611.1 DUF305 domain-containing protein [Amycolatopsis sp. SID8362]NED47305.1 DUF305 domain-containing protein [Amycolatopsis sp. SID8362]